MSTGIKIKNTVLEYVDDKSSTVEEHMNYDGTFYQCACGRLIINDGKPIIISESELLESGELYYDLLQKTIRKSAGSNNVAKDKKIIALSEHLSPRMLQYISEGKFKEQDRLLVVCYRTDTQAPKGYTHTKLTVDGYIDLLPIQQEHRWLRDEILKSEITPNN